MGGVRLNRHNLLGNILREEDLALLNDAAAGVEGAVLGDVPVCVDLGVDVEGSLDLDYVSLSDQDGSCGLWV